MKCRRVGITLTIAAPLKDREEERGCKCVTKCIFWSSHAPSFMGVEAGQWLLLVNMSRDSNDLNDL